MTARNVEYLLSGHVEISDNARRWWFLALGNLLPGLVSIGLPLGAVVDLGLNNVRDWFKLGWYGFTLHFGPIAMVHFYRWNADSE